MGIDLTRKYDQKSITQWARETFGDPAHTGLLLARLSEEFGEMMTGYECVDDLLMESADCAIFGYQLAEAEGVTIRSSSDLEDLDLETFGEVEHVIREFAAIVSAYASNKEIAGPLQNFFYALEVLANLYGTNLADLVDYKMDINVNRKWQITGQGIGQHIPEKGESND